MYVIQYNLYKYLYLLLKVRRIYGKPIINLSALHILIQTGLGNFSKSWLQDTSLYGYLRFQRYCDNHRNNHSSGPLANCLNQSLDPPKIIRQKIKVKATVKI